MFVQKGRSGNFNFAPRILLLSVLLLTFPPFLTHKSKIVDRSSALDQCFWALDKYSQLGVHKLTWLYKVEHKGSSTLIVIHHSHYSLKSYCFCNEYLSWLNKRTDIGPGYPSSYSDSLRAGKSGDRNRAGAISSAPAQTAAGFPPSLVCNS
jgi:hypothetical protein